jgi:ATP synthase protein I
MFTSVDSNRKKVEHPFNENVQFSQSLENSIIKESKSGIANQINNLLSQNDEYTKLQLTIFGITFIVAILLASITGIFLGFTFGFSIFIGAIAGIFYLRLLAKSVGKLGKESSGVSKLQLLVPVCLFIFASKLGSLDIFPAMIGFFIYKPSLIFYFSRS